jgi:leucyl/phenylalanyl-tRNA--protein transferase
MAESAESSGLHWFDPPVRAIIPLDDRFHVTRRLRRTLRQRPYAIRLNTDFDRVIRACSMPAPGRMTTWINSEITGIYTELHRRGQAHSIEAWQGDDLVGGLYGVSLGSAFFGESMFSAQTDASKIALVYLVTLLRSNGFTLLDTQFQTEHLSQFGTYEITRERYLEYLEDAIRQPAQLVAPENWDQLVEAYLTGAALQPVTQIS